MVAPRLLSGRYRLIEPIGEGGMSVVWLAHDEILRRRVAVKLLGADLPGEPRLRAEAQAAAVLSHPNVCAVYDYGVAEEPFVVMELLDGVSLGTQLQHGPLSWQRAVEVCAFVAAALSAAHARGLVHRDVKPANIMLTGSGVKVVDFGIAAFVGVPSDAPAMGTPGYLAPERLAGEPGGPSADVYALGAVLFAALTGNQPQMPPLPLPAVRGMPKDILKLYRQCVAPDPNTRPPVAAVARRLAALAGIRVGAVAGEPSATVELRTVPLASSAESAPPRPPWRRRTAAKAAAGAAVAAIGVAALAVGVASFGTQRSTGRTVPSGSCSVAYSIKDTWTGGATVSLSITDTGRADINGWTLTFDLADGLRTRGGWNGTWQQQGRHVTVLAAAHNAQIAPGTAALDVGTNIDGPGATDVPRVFALNGLPCTTASPSP
ncbi:serine/threonine-protein kinase [Dactylosporangium sp. NPDC048998]|uniref:serine/threonine-protein kinase n=1 Tax=Dactylosporangium sp. NPDC048998 TaxID=3363976 RepID=UPI00371B5F5F